jgi:hypothetical protein
VLFFVLIMLAGLAPLALGLWAVGRPGAFVRWFQAYALPGMELTTGHGYAFGGLLIFVGAGLIVAAALRIVAPGG